MTFFLSWFFLARLSGYKLWQKVMNKYITVAKFHSSNYILFRLCVISGIAFQQHELEKVLKRFEMKKWIWTTPHLNKINQTLNGRVYAWVIVHNIQCTCAQIISISFIAVSGTWKHQRATPLRLASVSCQHCCITKLLVADLYVIATTLPLCHFHLHNTGKFNIIALFLLSRADIIVHMT